MEENQSQLQALSESLQKIQDDLQDLISARQKLEAQQQENQSVHKEFSGLTDSNNIYKLVGPILLKQDRSEATNAVNGRLEYIGKEIERTEKKIRDLQDEGDKKRMALMQIQQSMQMGPQQQQQQQGQGAQKGGKQSKVGG